MDNPKGAELQGDVSNLLQQLEAEMDAEQLEQARARYEARETTGQLGEAG